MNSPSQWKKLFVDARLQPIRTNPMIQYIFFDISSIIYIYLINMIIQKYQSYENLFIKNYWTRYLFYRLFAFIRYRNFKENINLILTISIKLIIPIILKYINFKKNIRIFSLIIS